MNRTFYLLFMAIYLVMVSACAGMSPRDAPSASATSTAAAPARSGSGTGTFFTINEVGLGPNGFVALTNFTDVPASLAGLYLCQGADCFELPDVVVEAGQTVRVAAGDGAGLEGVVATRATFGELRPPDGEIAIYEAAEGGGPGRMTVYFQWGSTPHELTQNAIDAGLWVEGGYGPSSQNATRLYKVAESGLWLFEEP